MRARRCTEDTACETLFGVSLCLVDFCFPSLLTNVKQLNGKWYAAERLSRQEGARRSEGSTNASRSTRVPLEKAIEEDELRVYTAAASGQGPPRSQKGSPCSTREAPSSMRDDGNSDSVLLAL